MQKNAFVTPVYNAQKCTQTSGVMYTKKIFSHNFSYVVTNCGFILYSQSIFGVCYAYFRTIYNVNCFSFLVSSNLCRYYNSLIPYEPYKALLITFGPQMRCDIGPEPSINRKEVFIL